VGEWLPAWRTAPQLLLAHLSCALACFAAGNRRAACVPGVPVMEEQWGQMDLSFSLREVATPLLCLKIRVGTRLKLASRDSPQSQSRSPLTAPSDPRPSSAAECGSSGNLALRLASSYGRWVSSQRR
jgi:hypothetical protein